MKRHVVSIGLMAVLFAISNLVMSQQTFTYPVNRKQGFSLGEKTRDGVRVNYNLGQFSLNSLNYRGEDMAEISISGIVLPNTEGYPNLPVESRLVAVPQGATVRLNVVNLQSEIVRNVDVAPALRIQREDEEPDFNYVKNRDVYEKNAFYPENPFTIDRSSIRGVDVVAVSVSPFQFNPVTKELKVYTNIELSLSFEGGNGHFGDDRLRSPYWDPILAAELMNYDQLPVIDYAARMREWLRDDADGAEYLIITPNNDGWAEYANQLKDYRTRQGIITKVYRLDEMPATTTDAMKTWFHNAYNTWTIPPVAVLLFGDHNSNMAEGIPAEYTYHSSDYGDCITDNGYADVTGDNLPEMVFSRLVAANVSEAQMMASKQIEYEYSNPNMNASTYDKPITALGWQTERWFQICSEVVGGYWRNHGKHPVRINEIYDGEPGDVWSSNQNTTTVVNYFGPNGQGYIPATPSELGGWTGGTGTQVVNAVNSGAMLLQHRDHGYYQGWGEPDFNNSYVAQMNNVGKMTFVNTINCQTGTFDYGSNCLIEAFMRRTYNGQNAGAVGCIGPTQTSYSFVNDTYVWGMMDQYDPSFLPSYGPYANYEGNWQPAFGNVAGKYFLQQSSWPYNTGSKAITYKMFTAHCDAFLRLYTQVPRTMVVDHPVAVIAGVDEMDVMAPQGCMISLVTQNVFGGWDILAVAEATGSVQTIGFEPQVPPTEINLVVTGQDYLRYEAVLSVLPAEGSYLAVIGYDPSSAPVNQETPFALTIKNVGLDATTAPTIVTLTSLDNRLSILEGTAQLGVMASDATVTLTDAFSFIIDENVADNTMFQINVTMTCGSQTWTGRVYVKAEQAVLKYEGLSWDGGFVPGETITVTANFKNTGHYQATNAVATMTSTSNYITISNPIVTVGTIAVNQEVSCQYTVTIASNCPETAQIPVVFTMTANGGLTVQGNEVLKNACNVIFELNDSYGDGWNGNTLTVSFDDGTPSQELTIESGSAAVETLEIGNGVHVTLTWNTGSYANECSFTVSYEGNLVIYQSSGTPQAGVLYEFDCNCAAAFQTFTVTVASENTDHGTVSGGGEFNYGQSCTVVAMPAEGYFFTNWTQNGEVVSSAASYSFYVNGDMNLVAHFAEGFLIGDGGTATDQYLPSYNYYNYTLSQQIYTSEELGSAGNINSIAFYNGGAEKTRTYDFYLKNTSKSSFSNTTDWVVVSDADKVFSGTVTMAADGWTFITFDTPFNYDGTSNVVLVADDNSGAYTNSPHMACRVFSATSQAIRVYSDNTNYDPSAPSGYSGTLMNVKNQLLLNKETSTIGPLNITVSANPAEGGVVSGGGEYNFGATCTVTATPNAGYFFVNWTENGNVVSTDASYSFVVETDVDLVANFVEGNMIGGGGTATNQYLPSYNYYNYTLSQQIYTVEELGESGVITSIAFYNGGAEKTRTYDFYMKATDKASFSGTSDWETVTASDKVFSGTVTMAADAWTFINFDNPFFYYGTSNVVLVTDDNTGSYTSSPHMACRVFDAPSQAIRIYSDGANYDPSAPSGYSGTVLNVKNQLLLIKEEFSDCMLPTHLTATEVGPDFVELSWTENGLSEQWYVIYGNNYVVADINEGFMLEGLEPATEYTIMVRPVCDENLFSSAIVVTTLDACPIPQDVVVNNITHSAATVTWSGYSDSYNVQLGCPDILLYEEFTEGIPSGWINSENYPWTIVDGYMQSGNAGVASSTSSISVTVTFPAAGIVEFDAECKGEGTSTLWDKCIFSIDGEAQFTYGANVSGWNHYSFAVMAGEHTFTWSYTKDSSVNPTGDYFAVDNVKVCLSEINWSNSVSVWNAEYTFTGLTATTNYCVRVQGVCGDIETGWSEVMFFVTTEIPSITQTIELSQGWNWFSLYVEVEDPIEMLQTLEAALGENATEIQAFEIFTEYEDGEWWGDLDEIGITNDQTYMIYFTNDCTVQLQGLPANPANHAIEIKPGWNWIGFPSAVAMDINEAFSNFEAEVGDMIQASTIFTEFDGEEWFGDIAILIPGQGYMYYSNSSETKYLIFPTSTR